MKTALGPSFIQVLHLFPAFSLPIALIQLFLSMFPFSHPSSTSLLPSCFGSFLSLLLSVFLADWVFISALIHISIPENRGAICCRLVSLLAPHLQKLRIWIFFELLFLRVALLGLYLFVSQGDDCASMTVFSPECPESPSPIGWKLKENDQFESLTLSFYMHLFGLARLFAGVVYLRILLFPLCERGGLCILLIQLLVHFLLFSRSQRVFMRF